VRLSEVSLARIVADRGTIAGLQVDGKIYFNSTIFPEPSALLTPQGLYAFGHELVHVQQYFASPSGFGPAYRSNRMLFEKEAIEGGLWFRDNFIDPRL
jgi:hypothetical protein